MKSDVVDAATLSLTDLRAQFEAQFRALARAEEHLLKCRTADPQRQRERLKNFRAELKTMSTNNDAIRSVLDQMERDTESL